MLESSEDYNVLKSLLTAWGKSIHLGIGRQPKFPGCMSIDHRVGRDMKRLSACCRVHTQRPDYLHIQFYIGNRNLKVTMWFVCLSTFIS